MLRKNLGLVGLFLASTAACTENIDLQSKVDKAPPCVKLKGAVSADRSRAILFVGARDLEGDCNDDNNNFSSPITSIAIYMDDAEVARASISSSSLPFFYRNFEVKADPGIHVVQARAYDLFGNEGRSSGLTLDFRGSDLENPKVKFDVSHLGGSSYRVNYVVTDGVGVRRVDLYFSNRFIQSRDYDGSQTSVSGFFDVRHARGAFNYIVRAEDASGKSGVSQRYFYVAGSESILK